MNMVDAFDAVCTRDKALLTNSSAATCADTGGEDVSVPSLTLS